MLSAQREGLRYQEARRAANGPSSHRHAQPGLQHPPAPLVKLPLPFHSVAALVQIARRHAQQPRIAHPVRRGPQLRDGAGVDAVQDAGDQPGAQADRAELRDEEGEEPVLPGGGGDEPQHRGAGGEPRSVRGLVLRAAAHRPRRVEHQRAREAGEAGGEEEGAEAGQGARGPGRRLAARHPPGGVGVPG